MCITLGHFEELKRKLDEIEEKYNRENLSGMLNVNINMYLY